VDSRSWFINEESFAGPEHLDSEYVQRYDRKAGFDPASELAKLKELGLGAGTTLVDIGAGTGEMSLAAAEICDRVYAVDVSAAMLDALRAKAVEHHATNLQIVHAGFLTYEHRDEPVDIVYTRHALHHLPDFWKAIALTRIARILKPGGILKLIDLTFNFEPRDAEEVIDSWLAGARDDPQLGWTRAELESHLRGEYSTFTWLLEPMLVRAGFLILDAAYDDSLVSASYTCVRE
jgi:ubiquinone/menaquinone biosynthesis C-methylase UbiE